MNSISKMLLIFIMAQLLGVVTGGILIMYSRIIPEFEELKVNPVGPSDSPLNALYMIGVTVLGAAVLLVVIHFYKGKRLFNALEFFLIFSSVSIVAWTLLIYYLDLSCTNFSLPNYVCSSDNALVFSGLLALALATAKMFVPGLRNITAIISSAGVGAFIGFSLGIYPALLFIVLLSLYDYIAVFKTRHMITLAKELSSRDLSFSVTTSEAHSDEKPAFKSAKENVEEQKMPETKSRGVELGSGDLAIPIVITVSSLGSFGVLPAIGSMAGSIVGLYYTLNLVTKNRVLLPALPPICFFASLGLFILSLVQMFLGLTR